MKYGVVVPFTAKGEFNGLIAFGSFVIMVLLFIIKMFIMISFLK